MASGRAQSRKKPMLATGPFRGVRNTKDPYDDTPDLLVDAMNCYIPDPQGGSGLYARPGFAVVNPLSALTGKGQGIHTHIDLDGMPYNFIASGGKLYLVDADLVTFTDVTPIGVVIDATAPRVYFTSFIGSLVIHDGVTAPWIATDLGSTPVTATPIDFDGSGTAWSAFGQPFVYGGSIFFVLNEVDGVGARLDIAWSAPADPAIGYQQPDYDFRWTLQQTGTGPIYGICASNVALFYWRDGSIGAITGTPGPDLQQTATHDAVSVNVGALQSATFATYGNTIFFCDVNGRPWRMVIGSAPEPIWLNLRAIVDTSTSGYPQATATVSCATILPSLNLYLAAIWSPVAGVAAPPTQLQAFDAKTGAYVGRWSWAGGTSIEAVGVLNNTGGRGSLIIVGSKVNGANPAGGYVWAQNNVVSGGIVLVTEDGDDILTEGGEQITTENTVPSWLDNDSVPEIYATTQRLGYSATTVWNVDTVTAVTTTNSPCAVVLLTTTASNTLQGVATPSASQDGTYRIVVGADVQGRGTQVTIGPTTAEAQWSLQSVEANATPSLAQPIEP